MMTDMQNIADLPKSSDQLIKYTASHYRQEGVSHEDFVRYMTDEHIPAALPLFKKHGIVKYSLVSRNGEYRHRVTFILMS